MFITPGQNKRLHALLGQLGWNQYKKDLVFSASGERTEHSSELTSEEATNLIKHLEAQAKTETPQAPKEDPADKMRKKILSCCHQMAWYVPGVINLKTGKQELDFARIDAYCVKYSAVHKKLNEHTEEELPVLVLQFQRVLKGYLNKVK